MVGRLLGPEFQLCLSHTFGLEPKGVVKLKTSNGMTIMATTTKTTDPENSITLFRSLIAEMDLSTLSETQLYDLGAIATESADGLCHGLLCLSESLDNCEVVPPEGVLQISAYLKATAHLMPMLFELCEQANSRLAKTNKMTANLLN